MPGRAAGSLKLPAHTWHIWRKDDDDDDDAAGDEAGMVQLIQYQAVLTRLQ